jgi:hypothetical protein
LAYTCMKSQSLGNSYNSLCVSSCILKFIEYIKINPNKIIVK